MDYQRLMTKKNKKKTLFLKKLVERHIISFIVLFLLLNIIMLHLEGIILQNVLEVTQLSNIVKFNIFCTIFQVAGGILFLFLIYRLDALYDIGFFKKEGIVKGLFLGLPVISFLLYALLGYVSAWHFKHLPQAYEILIVFFLVLSIGFWEELSFRGLFLCGLLKHWNHTKYGTIYAVLLSSIFFGLMHFPGKENLLHAVCHVFSTIMAGMFFGTIFLRTKSIWSVILLHAIYDLLSQMCYFVFAAPYISYISPAKGINYILNIKLINANENTDWILLCVFNIPLFVAAIIYLKEIIKDQDT